MVISKRTVTEAALHLLYLGYSPEVVANSVIALLARGNSIPMMSSVIVALSRHVSQEHEYSKVRVDVARNDDANPLLVKHMLDIINASDREYVVSVHPDLIGGFIAKTESMCHDYSIRNTLLQLEHNYKTQI